MSSPPRPGAAAPFVPPLLAALRAGTRAAHETLEAEPVMAALLAPDLTRAAYVAVLRAMHAFHAGMGRALAPHILAGLWPRAMDDDRLRALDEDLAWLGATAARPMTLRLPPEPAALLGACYVLEGSALGGRVIGRAVARSLGVGPQRGGSYYCGASAEDARARWQQFCGTLANAEAALSPACVDAAIAAANAAFSAIADVLRRSAAAAPGARSGGLILPARTPTGHAAARTMI